MFEQWTLATFTDHVLKNFTQFYSLLITLRILLGVLGPHQHLSPTWVPFNTHLWPLFSPKYSLCEWIYESISLNIHFVYCSKSDFSIGIYMYLLDFYIHVSPRFFYFILIICNNLFSLSESESFRAREKTCSSQFFFF